MGDRRGEGGEGERKRGRERDGSGGKREWRGREGSGGKRKRGEGKRRERGKREGEERGGSFATVLWNVIFLEIRLALSLSAFCKSLKTYLWAQAWDPRCVMKLISWLCKLTNCCFYNFSMLLLFYLFCICFFF